MATIKAMLCHRRKHGLHIVRRHHAAPPQVGPGLGRRDQRLGGSRAQSRARPPAGLHQIHHITNQGIAGVDGAHGLLRSLKILRCQPGLQLLEGGVLPAQHGRLRLTIRKPQGEPHQKTIQLRFR